MSDKKVSGKNVNCDIVRLLASRGADLNIVESGPKPFSPLFHAIEQQDIDLVEALLESGSDANFTVRYLGQTMAPIHFAIRLCNLKIVQVLIENGANVDSTIPEIKETAVHVSSGIIPANIREKIANECILRLLLQCGSDPNVRCKKKLTPLLKSLKTSNYDLAKVLICHDNGALLNQDCVFHEIMKSNRRELIELSLSYGADLFLKDQEGRYPVQVFIAGSIHLHTDAADVIDVIKLVWGYGFPVELTIPKRVIVSKQSISQIWVILKQLIKAQNLLYRGIKENNPDMVKQAVNKGAIPSVFQDVQFPLHSVASNGNVSSFKLFLSKTHVQVNSLNKQGKTPLHLAAEFGHVELCILLLENGAIYNPVTKRCKETPLELARKKGHSDVVEMLKQIKGIFQTLTTKEKLAKLDLMKAVLNCMNRQGHSLMSQALEMGLTSVAERILMKKLKWQQ